MKISFLDFWDGFEPQNNFFIDLIRTFIPNVIVTNPIECDFLFFSCFGNQNRNYMNKKRIFYTGENLRPNYDSIEPLIERGLYRGKCDFSLSFDFSKDDKNIRVPLWLMQIDWFNKINYGNPKYVIPIDKLFDNNFYNNDKNKFCSFVFNNTAPHRWEFINEMNKYKKVDCFGKPHGNWFYGEDHKLQIISNYKFNVCFENASYSGYYTEKPIHAKVAGCVPIYWADDNFSNDFNSNAFINLNDFSNMKDLVDYIVDLDKNFDKYNLIRSEKIFTSDNFAHNLLDEITKQIKNILL